MQRGIQTNELPVPLRAARKEAAQMVSRTTRARMRAIMLVSAIAANRFIATQLLQIGVLAREQAVQEQERALLEGLTR
jgi:hypothetical protein